MDVTLDIKPSGIWRLSGIPSCEQKVTPWNRIHPGVRSGKHFIQDTARWQKFAAFQIKMYVKWKIAAIGALTAQS